MTNQTIDGVQRDDLELVLIHGHSTTESNAAWDRLRALLDAKPIMCHGCMAEGVSYDHFDSSGKCKAAQPQGEPVARHPDAIIEGVMTSVGITHAIYAITVSLKHGEQVKLYAEQPAPVAVLLLPERLNHSDGLHTYEYVTGHNAAIDKMLGIAK